MITAERVRACRDLDGVLQLFAELGYPIRKVAVDLSEWQRAGMPDGWEGADCYHVSRVGAVDMLAAAGIDRAAIAQCVAWANARNAINTTIAIYHDGLSRRLFVIGSRRRAPRHFEVDLERPAADSLDRLNLLELKCERDDPQALFDRAFDREAVTRQFFSRFRRGVTSVGEILAERCPEASRDAIAGEALLLLSRILFLSFVQEKGWLDGRRRFLAEEIDRALREGRAIFDTLLLPLFFGCLNTPAAVREPAARALGAIPYLNGGLFEPSPFELRNLPFSIPDTLLKHLFEDLFDRYAFRIDESEEGTEIDPEMLGKVFESLMEADERSASGSFYTPREIVDRMAHRAVAEWLGRNPREREIARALLAGEAAPLAPADAQALKARLDGIAVLDPACGSGAYLLSALRAIERLHRALDAALGVAADPALRQRIVERSLHGVDVKSEAVRLCELRLWLAIVSRSDAAIEAVPPLPNLDRNILQGNALLGPLDFLGTGRLQIYREWLRGLRAQEERIARYRSGPASERPLLVRELRESDRALASALLEKAIENDERELAMLAAPAPRLFGPNEPAPPQDRRRLADRIAESRATLDRLRHGELDFFAFDVHFAHVVAARNGFDVVLGNPPWVRAHRVEPTMRRMCAERYRFYGGSRGFDQPDLAIAFVERALGLVSRAGVVSLLLSAKVGTADYAARLRQHLVRETTILAIDDWSREGRRRFDADAFPLGVTIRNERDDRQLVEVASSGSRFALRQTDLGSGSAAAPWCLAPPEVSGVFRRLRSELPAFAEALHRRPVMGVKTGANRCFFFDRLTLSNGRARVEGTALEIPRESLARCVRGRDVRRWRASESTWLLWPPIGGWPAPPEWARALAEHFGVSTERLRLAYVRPEHLGIKVAWKDLSQGLQAVVLPATSRVGETDFPLVPNQTLYAIDAASFDEAYALSALLNSTIVNALALGVADRAKDAHFRYFGATIAALPAPVLVPGSEEWGALVRLARRAHRGEPSAREIDAVVNDLYRLSRSEARRVEEWLAASLTLR